LPRLAFGIAGWDLGLISFTSSKYVLSCLVKEEEMDRAGYQHEQETLKGIVSTLLKLAVLAELLCVVPSPVRALLLWLLRPAEAVARAFAEEETGRSLALPSATTRGANGDSCVEALQLAYCFRALAAIFSSLQAIVARQIFRDRPNRHRAQHASAMAWRNHFLGARHTIAAHGAARLDTS
jgi:hypothetical protein